MVKKILHLTHTDIKTDSRILKEMGALAKAGYEVKGLGIQLEEGAAETSIAFNAEIDTIKLSSRQFKSLPRTLRHALSLCELLVKMLPRVIRLRPDVIHCHDTLVLPLGAIAKIITRAKLVYDAHELESDRNGLSKLQGKITLFFEKLLWRCVDSLIVVSPSIQKWYLDNVGPKPSVVILNSPLFESYDFAREKYLHKKFNIPNDRLIFIYIGIFGRGRGLDHLIRAFSSEGIKSHIVFLGFGEFSSRLGQLAVEKDNFHVHEAVPHSRVVPIARSADFGLCLIENISLSDYLCLPNKLFEYCFAGIPVLASNFPDIKKIIDEYGVGECCDLDVDVVVETIKKIEMNTLDFSFKNLQPLTWQDQEKILLNLYAGF